MIYYLIPIIQSVSLLALISLLMPTICRATFLVSTETTECENSLVFIMNLQMQAVLTCPVCIDLLKKPVLALPCQHNLCKLCVEELSKSTSLRNRCPTCRREFSLGSGGIDNLPRNRLVEEMIDELLKAEATTTSHSSDVVTYSKPITPSVTVPKRPIKEVDVPGLRELANNLMMENKYAEAKKVLEQLQDDVEELLSIKIKLDILRCCSKMEEDPTVFELGNIIIPTLSNVNLLGSDRETAADLMRTFAKELSGNYENITAINLLKSAADVCAGINDPAKQLVECMSCLELMQGITKSMARRNMKQEFRQFTFPAINHIFCYITKIQLEGREMRCIKIAWSLKYIGFCCNEIGDFEKSVEYNNRSINHLKEHLHQQAGQHRVLGVSYHNLAAAYKNSGKYLDAETAYLKAIESYHTAKDWPSEERRNNNVILSAMGLSEAHKLLHK